MLVHAYAKINLYLNVLGTLPNGYHEIESLMQSVGLCDDVSVRVEEAARFSISLDPGRADLPADAGNLAWRAAEAMHARYHAERPERIDIRVTKRIPVAAGLAGGSADGAAVIAALCELWEREPDYELAARLGADVPFCLAAQHGLPAAVATGTGTELSPRMGEDFSVLLATPAIAVPTAAVYRALREDDCRIRHSLETPGNHLQAPALRLFPQIRETLAWAEGLGAKRVQLSGSGPTVFALFARGEAPDLQTLQATAPAGTTLNLTECR